MNALDGMDFDDFFLLLLQEVKLRREDHHPVTAHIIDEVDYNKIVAFGLADSKEILELWFHQF